MVSSIHRNDAMVCRSFNVSRHLENDVDVALRRNLARGHDGYFSAARDVIRSPDGTGRNETIGLPVRARCSGACAFDIEISERAELNAGHEAQLCKNHRSEFAGADLRNANRAALFRSSGKHT
jgi:hypothetical protein